MSAKSLLLVFLEFKYLKIIIIILITDSSGELDDFTQDADPILDFVTGFLYSDQYCYLNFRKYYLNVNFLLKLQKSLPFTFPLFNKIALMYRLLS